MDPIWGYFFLRHPWWLMGGVEPNRLTEDQRKYLSMVTSRTGKPRDASWNCDLMMETLETPSHCLHVVPFFIVHSYWRDHFCEGNSKKKWTFKQFQAINFLQLFDATKYSNSFKLLPKLEAEFQWPCLTVILFTIKFAIIMKIVINHQQCS